MGQTTSDGSAVFTARDAFTRDATVASVTNNRIFTISATTHPDSVDGWLNSGEVIWETGANAGSAVEIKDWTQSSSTIELLLEMPSPIAVNDRLKFSPGCFKRRTEDCRNKFRIPNSVKFALGNVRNFDGEPDLPGPDYMLFSLDEDN